MALLTLAEQIELKTLISDLLNSAVKEATLNTKRLTQKQAIQYIGVISSYNSLKKLESQGLKRHQLNGKTYYLKDEIDDFIKQHDIPSNLD